MIENYDMMYKNYHSYDTVTTSNYQLKLIVPKNDARGAQTNSFNYSTVKAWNKLSKIVKNPKNINMFKTKLGEIWKELP